MRSNLRHEYVFMAKTYWIYSIQDTPISAGDCSKIRTKSKNGVKGISPLNKGIEAYQSRLLFSYRKI